MTTVLKSRVAIVFTGLATCMSAALLSTSALAQPGQERGAFGLDPRAEDRTYRFADTGEDLPYCVFVSSKVSDDSPAPLIISLHGLGAGPQIMCNSTAVELAEAGGYILAAPMGYNTGGWYGSPMLSFSGRGADPGRAGNNGIAPMTFDAINQADEDGNRDDHLTFDEVRGFFAGFGGNNPRGDNDGPGPSDDFVAAIFRRWDANDDGKVTEQEFDGRPPVGGFGGGNQPENLAELSEKDVMNVLELMREEFNVDDDRIYLTGHSMGGAGTLFLGAKHADLWAAIAPVAPAAFAMTENRANILQDIKNGGVPVMLVHGDADEAVPIDLARTWAATMAEIDVEHEYVELPGVTHGPVITASQKHIYEFFGKHTKTDAR